MKSVELKRCPQCGEPFRPRPNRLEQTCCSRACRTRYFRERHATNWRGGRTENPRNGMMIRMDIESPQRSHARAWRYIEERRAVASEAIGRVLEPYELVIHIDPLGGVEPGNLFICASRREAARRQHGKLPWPTESNLATYRDRVT